jgi:hypothetical protein
MFDTRN